MSARIDVTVLGATGVVGQRFAARLARHPRFRLAHLAASGRSEGKRFDEACAWRVPGSEPWAGEGARRLAAADPAAAFAPVVFSALDAGAAREIEPAFARAGALVFSNAGAFRMEADVPLLVPEVNPDHLALIDAQRRARGWKGAIVCNPNCTAAGLVVVLGPLHETYGVEKVLMASLQAASGAGYPGVASLDLLGNVVPYIAGEEEKVEQETQKILGTYGEQGIRPAAAVVSALCNRVPVLDGHSESVSVALRGAPDPPAVRACLAQWKPRILELGLPSAPAPPIVVHDAPDRPQPRLDAEQGGGMPVHVGRIRRCPLLGIKLQLVAHNAERGAAGASVLNAELALALGRIP